MINYQIMEESQKLSDGKYLPDYQKLIDQAETQEEKEYIKQVWRYRHNTFVFNLVYVVKQKCGHYEMFQSPQNEYYPLKEILKRAEEDGLKRRCTRCICNF